jgi:Fungalysin metallopeptidase (M36)/CARDB/Fungalysin/Thermolysin Propeptide Motif
MPSRIRIGLVLGAIAVIGVSGPIGARQQPPGDRAPSSRPNFDVRAERAPARGSASAVDELARARRGQGRNLSRLHPYTGAISVLDSPGWSVSPAAPASDLHATLEQSADRLGLDNEDLDSLAVVRDYVSQSTGLRHVTFAQSLDGVPVFGAAVTVHVAQDGTIVRVTSSAARRAGRRGNAAVPAEGAAAAAAADVGSGAAFVPIRVGGNSQHARFDRGPFRREVTASLEWFPIDGGARLAWHVELEPDGAPQFYDLVIDAESGELLLRRNRVLDAEGTGRVIQSNATQALDPRQPDQKPVGADGCPPPVNHELRDLTAPFRDPSTVLFNTGRLSGNNARVFRRTAGTEGALGTFDGTRWIFDAPFNSAASAETSVFFSLNFAHDFFYDLGFDEAAGNFQVDNFGRGGAGGDPIIGLARASGRNNATFQPTPEGSSPTMSLFLFDGLGCWSQDVDGDGSLDIDGDYDNDILLHEFHHGVSHRLNTEFTGNEAGAIGEGASDFFAYTINGDTTLAEYSRPGGLRGVNAKTYANWSCLLFIFCEVHANGEIWANSMWDIRERFRADLVRGSESAAINEVNQLYIDGLKLSPPAPTMLDLRDAMLLADTLRNPGSPQSQNFCRLWESFAGRGMGVNATDTSDNGMNQVTASSAVPPGCNAPPVPLTVTLQATDSSAAEAGPANGAFTISRSEAMATDLAVNLTVGGTATNGSDYVSIPSPVVIPSGALSVTVPVVPIDDPTVEGNETVVLSVAAGAGYVAGTPASGTVTIVSDDAAPDFLVSVLTAPTESGAGSTITASDTTRNQGGGAGGASTTSFYLSLNSVLDAGDPLIGSRQVPALAPGATHSGDTPVTIPEDTVAGTYRIIAKADGPGELVEGSESNNLRAVSVRIGPDLIVSALTVPSNVPAGLPFLISDTTLNQGGGPSDGSVTRIYLSVNSGLDASDDELQSHTVNALGPDATQVVNTNITLPADTTGGQYYLLVVTDADNSVPETSDNNNIRAALLRVGPDLKVSAISAPSAASAGSQIAVTDTTRNEGASGAGASTTAFYFSSNLSLSPDDFVLSPSRAVPPLGVGASSAGTTTVTVPAAATPGLWYVLAVADDLDQVAEAYETNNIRTTTVAIGPDLTVSSISTPTTVVAGASINVSDTIKNTGAEVSGGSTTRFYLSLNSSLDPTDIDLAVERIVPSLGVNATNTGTTTITIPTGLSGRYYLIFVADGNGQVAEARETNNTRAASITINP